jgi:hypothetical protein
MVQWLHERGPGFYLKHQKKKKNIKKFRISRMKKRSSKFLKAGKGDIERSFDLKKKKDKES